MIKLVHDKTNARIVFEDDSINVFYTDNLVNDYYVSDETLDTIVNMYNDGKTLFEIDEFLLDDIGCTQNAREVIIDSLSEIYISNENKFVL